MEKKPAITLMEMVKEGKVNATRSLLEAGADPRRIIPGYERHTLLHAACKAGHHTTIVRLLLDAGADVNAKDRDGWTPLHYVCRSGHADIFRLLLQHGAEVEVRDRDGWTPLYLACWNGHLDIARLLLSHGADVNAKTRHGVTPLHLAGKKLGYKLVHLLLSHGADVNVQDKDDTTPLHWAMNRVRGRRRVRRTESVRLLLRAGAEGGVRDKGGKTPLDFVLPLPPDHPAREEIIDLFREYAPEAVMEAYCSQTNGPEVAP